MTVWPTSGPSQMHPKMMSKSSHIFDAFMDELGPNLGPHFPLILGSSDFTFLPQKMTPKWLHNGREKIGKI